MPTQAAPTAGWATSVCISARRASSRASSSNAAGGKMSGPSAGPPCDSTTRSNSSKAPRTSGKTTASSWSMPGDCAPWPGKRNATSAPRPLRLRREEDPPRIFEIWPALGDRPPGQDQLVAEVIVRARHDGQRGSRSGPAPRRPLGGTGPDQASREISQRRTRTGLEPYDQRIEAIQQPDGLIGFPDHQLRRPFWERHGRFGIGIAVVGLEDRVEVGPAETERAHPGSPRPVVVGMEPGLGLRAESEWAVL